MRKVRVRGVVKNGDTYLFVRLLKTPDYWCLPGGGVEDNEPLEAALKREFVEELGVIPKIGQLFYIQQFIVDGVEQLEFIYLIENAQDFANIDITRTSHGSAELAEAAFINPHGKTILPKFLSHELTGLDTSTTQPVRVFSYL